MLSGTRRIGKSTAELSATLSTRRFFHENITNKNALFFAVTHKWTHTLDSLTVNAILKSEGSRISSEISGTIKPQSRYGLAADWFPWSMVAFRSVHLVQTHPVITQLLQPEAEQSFLFRILLASFVHITSFLKRSATCSWRFKLQSNKKYRYGIEI